MMIKNASTLERESSEQRTYKVPTSTYYWTGFVTFGLGFFLFEPCLFANPPYSLEKVMMFSIVAVMIPTATLWWLSRFKIILTSGELTYSSAYYGTRTVKLSDIKSAGIIRQYPSRRGQRPLLEVKTSEEKFTINFTVFSREAREDLFSSIFRFAERLEWF